MKLTRTLREAFVRAAMSDVPQIDYQEKIQKIANTSAFNAMPPDIQEAFKKHPEYFNQAHVQIGDDMNYPYYIWTGVAAPDHFKHGHDANLQAAELLKLKKAQEEKRAALEKKLAAVAASATTRKALTEMLPEFEKYLPGELAKTSLLPAIVDVVADFAKAGWPKDQVAA